MTANSKAKLKLLYLMRMLQEETDSEHGLPMRGIIERLEEEGIPAERKSIYRDIELLREFGLDIKTYQRNPVEYALERRDFDLPELMLLVDAVESCKFLTRHRANTLEGNLKSLASGHQQELLERRVHVRGRIKSESEGVFDSINVIHKALRLRRKLSFRYFRYGLDGKRHERHAEGRYLVTPVGVTLDEGFYYLTAWNEQHDRMMQYRLDRMGYIKVSDEQATRNDEITHHTFTDTSYEYFGRFEGEEQRVTLEVDADAVEILMDRFGLRPGAVTDAGGVGRVTVTVRVSPQFFGWLAGVSDKVSLVSPTPVVDRYREFLRGAADKAGVSRS